LMLALYLYYTFDYQAKFCPPQGMPVIPFIF
jgi:hypothetical protein